jgi:uncharacterized UBP type Zn finger protein
MFIFNLFKDFFSKDKHSKSTYIINESSSKFVYFKIENSMSFSLEAPIFKKDSLNSELNFDININRNEIFWPSRLEKEKYIERFTYKIIFGFPNTGNSCYLNSALQIIIHQPFKILDKLILITNSNENYDLCCRILKKIMFYTVNYSKSEIQNYEYSILHNLLIQLKKEIISDEESFYDSQQDANEIYMRLISKLLIQATMNICSRVQNTNYTCKSSMIETQVRKYF